MWVDSPRRSAWRPPGLRHFAPMLEGEGWRPLGGGTAFTCPNARDEIMTEERVVGLVQVSRLFPARFIS